MQSRLGYRLVARPAFVFQFREPVSQDRDPLGAIAFHRNPFMVIVQHLIRCEAHDGAGREVKSVPDQPVEVWLGADRGTGKWVRHRRDQSILRLHFPAPDAGFATPRGPYPCRLAFRC